MERNSGTKNHLNEVIFSNDNFIIVGSSGTLITSKDGRKWYARTTKLRSDLKSVISSKF